MQIWVHICLLLILQFVISGCRKKGVLPHKCKLPPKKGKCKKLLERIYYDHEKKTCLSFIYGGCGGNKNNFVTLKDCFYNCKKFDPTRKTAGGFDWEKLTSKRCKAKPNTDWCGKYITGYYFDSSRYRCRPLNFYGCGLNENNFESYRECVETCDVFGNGPITER